MWIFLVFSISAGIVTLGIKQGSQKALRVIRTYPLPDDERPVVRIENYYNLQYYATFHVGTPGQEITLILDTGSSWTWVPASNCSCHETNYSFQSNTSSSFKGSGEMIVQHYGRGMISGQIFQDSLRAGPVSASQEMILVYQDNDLAGLSSSGLLGLGFKELSRDRKTFIENLKKEGKTEKAEFSIFLNNLNSNHDLESVFVIGGTDPKYIGGEGVTLNVVPNVGFWIINIESYQVGEKVNKERFLGLVDTGTSFLYVPNKIFDEFFLEINKTGRFIVDESGFRLFECKEEEVFTFPELKFKVDEQEMKISSENYLFYEQGICYLFVDANEGSYWLLGQVFIREYYLKFDMENFKIVAYPPFRNVVKNDGSAYVLACFGIGIIGLVVFVSRKKRAEEEKVGDGYLLMSN
jgi:hypothetical protein